MKRAVELIAHEDPNLEVEGEMTADMALDPEYRKKVFPNSKLRGPANLLVMPDLDAAHIAFNLTRVVSDSVTVGPILMGARKPVHILTASASVRRVVNMTAIAAVDAQMLEAGSQEDVL
jgi:malate dehydrogenase (oxaloacetate-decarboxylating)(NADP+)